MQRTISISHDLSGFNNMNHVGPGMWYMIHLLSYKADRASDINHNIVVNIIYMTANSIECSKCRNHFLGYLREYPPNTLGRLLEWSVEFHNSVNQKLYEEGNEYKRIIPLGEVSDYFFRKECRNGCIRNKTIPDIQSKHYSNKY